MIAILAAITIVSYSGIRTRTIQVSLQSDLSTASEQLQVYNVSNGTYPATLATAGLKSSNGTAFAYAVDTAATPASFCLSAYNPSIAQVQSIDSVGKPSNVACAGASTNDPACCPETSYVKLNGYYCEGTVASTAGMNSPAIKQLASASGVPANAPGYYVGVQTTRDNLIGQSFTVASGEVYCLSGYAATTNSTVVHTIGLMLNGSGQSTV